MHETAPEVMPEPPLLTHPRAVVIGASSGIGAALTRRLAREGYVVAALARREEALRSLCEEINEESDPPAALPYPHDVTALEEIPALFQTLLKDLRGIDLVAFVAGAMPEVGPREYDFEKDRQMIEVNFMSAVAWLSQAATLFDRMGEGQIVGVSSVAGERGRVLNPAYNASKAGLTAYLEGLRNRLSRRGVGVLTVKPGFVDTAMLENAARTFWVVTPDQAARQIWRAIQAGRQDVYIPGRWRMVMWVIRNIPSVIFRRLSF